MEILRFFGSVRNKYLVPFRLVPEGGIPPDKMAFSITLGVVAGVFPVLGATTAISLLLTMLFRQNLVVVQAVQWIMAMLQIILIVPFMQLGAIILKARSVDISLHQINISFQHGFFQALKPSGCCICMRFSPGLYSPYRQHLSCIILSGLFSGRENAGPRKIKKSVTIHFDGFVTNFV